MGAVSKVHIRCTIDRGRRVNRIGKIGAVARALLILLLLTIVVCNVVCRASGTRKHAHAENRLIAPPCAVEVEAEGVRAEP